MAPEDIGNKRQSCDLSRCFLSAIQTSRWHGSCEEFNEAVIRVMERQSGGFSLGNALIEVGGGEIGWSIKRPQARLCPPEVQSWENMRQDSLDAFTLVCPPWSQTDSTNSPSLSLCISLNRGSNWACLDSVYLIQPNIYPSRYLLCSALKPVKACACSRREGGMTGAEVRVHWKGKHSQPAHVKARRCILPKNEETDLNFTSTLDVAPKCLPTTKSTDTLTIK